MVNQLALAVVMAPVHVGRREQFAQLVVLENGLMAVNLIGIERVSADGVVDYFVSQCECSSFVFVVADGKFQIFDDLVFDVGLVNDKINPD